jgi:hypothetical protein
MGFKAKYLQTRVSVGFGRLQKFKLAGELRHGAM